MTPTFIILRIVQIGFLLWRLTHSSQSMHVLHAPAPGVLPVIDVKAQGLAVCHDVSTSCISDTTVLSLTCPGTPLFAERSHAQNDFRIAACEAHDCTHMHTCIVSILSLIKESLSVCHANKLPLFRRPVFHSPPVSTVSWHHYRTCSTYTAHSVVTH